MKKIFTLLALLISLGLTSEIIATNLQVASSATGFTSIDGKGVATFVVTSPQAQVCDLSFLMMPGEYEDGSFTSVTLKVNGVTLPNPITFNTYGWQAANTTDNAVTLNKGTNNVQFISGRDDVPLVREVKIWNGKKIIFPRPNISNLSENNNRIDNKSSLNNIKDSVKNYVQNYLQYIRPLFRPGVQSKMKYYYTTSIDIYYENANSIAHFYAPTSWDPMFGQYESTIDYNAYLFYKADPSVYSKRFSTIDHYAYWQDTIPVAGEYCLIMEPKNMKEVGWASIRINNSNLYRMCYISQDSTIEVRRKDIANNIYVSAQDSIYNMFTTHNIETDTISHMPDPVLWLKERVINGTDTSDIIVAYSDSNAVRSNFEWGKNARIRTKLDSTKQYFLTLSSALPYVQSSNPDICDLYHSYWNNIDTLCYLTENSDNNLSNRFPQLIYEDIIESDIGGMYNCFAWTGWITTNWITPQGNNLEEQLQWLDLFYDNKPVQSYGMIKRPSFFPKYTRHKAEAKNSIIDIWGYPIENGYKASHASIKSPFVGLPIGYDWESKDGSQGPRFFHPRYALASPIFGRVVDYYTLTPDQGPILESYTGLVYSAIADGELVIEDIKLTEDEKSLLSKNIPATYRVDKFEQYYNQWKEYAKTKFHYSDFEYYKDAIAYPQLVNYILSNPGEEYKAYKKFDDGDYFAAVLIKDISSIEGTRAKYLWDKIMNAPIEENIIKTSWGNVRLFIKSMLQDVTNENIPQTGRIKSNDDDVEVVALNGKVKVSVKLDKPSMYSVKIINLQTSQQSILLPKSMHQPGVGSYQFDIASGIYVIAVLIDENINAKKIIIK